MTKFAPKYHLLFQNRFFLNSKFWIHKIEKFVSGCVFEFDYVVGDWSVCIIRGRFLGALHVSCYVAFCHQHWCWRKISSRTISGNYLARCEKHFCTTTLKVNFLDQNLMNMQKPTLPNFEISSLDSWNINSDSRKIRNWHFQTQNEITIVNSWAENLISKISKSVFLIPLESHFETPKFEFSDIENPKILIFASKFKFFFDQNLDFVLGYFDAGGKIRCWSELHAVEIDAETYRRCWFMHARIWASNNYCYGFGNHVSEPALHRHNLNLISITYILQFTFRVQKTN